MPRPCCCAALERSGRWRIASAREEECGMRALDEMERYSGADGDVETSEPGKTVGERENRMNARSGPRARAVMPCSRLSSKQPQTQQLDFAQPSRRPSGPAKSTAARQRRTCMTYDSTSGQTDDADTSAEAQRRCYDVSGTHPWHTAPYSPRPDSDLSLIHI